MGYSKIALECRPLESYAASQASCELLKPTMNGTPKLVCLILSILVVASLPGLGDQRLLSDNKTIVTPVGKVGIWRITEINPSYTRHEYWVLFGRLGKWHIKDSSHGRPTALLPIIVLASIAGVLVVAAGHRRTAEPDSDSVGRDKPGACA